MRRATGILTAGRREPQAMSLTLELLCAALSASAADKNKKKSPAGTLSARQIHQRCLQRWHVLQQAAHPLGSTWSQNALVL